MPILRLAPLAALAFLAAAQAAPLLSKQEIKAHQVRIEEQYDHAQTRCGRVQGPARELCHEQARGERDIQSAELQMQAEPTPGNDLKLRLARAEAAYSTALVKCKTLDGSARSVCRADAKTVYEDAKTEAKLQAEVAAPAIRAENTVRERTAQAQRVAEAQYKAARERCAALPAEGRANCLEDAKKFAPETLQPVSMRP
jgi:hypothetical protein